MDLEFGSDDDSDFEMADVDSDDDSSLSSMDDKDDLLPFPDDMLSPADCSVQELEEKLKEHIEARSITEYLTKVDEKDENAEFIPQCRPPSDMTDSWEMVGKLYGTPLLFACYDMNEARQLEKICLILETAQRHLIDMQTLLTACMKLVYRDSDGVWAYHKRLKANGNNFMPIWILISNLEQSEYYSIEPVRLLCKAYPPIVFERSFADEEGWTPLHYVCNTNSSPERLQSLVDILLEAANETEVGAKGLVQSRPELRNKWCTPLHVLTQEIKDPHKTIRRLLNEWPDALLYCQEGPSDSNWGYPFHTEIALSDNRCFNCETFQSKVDSLKAFFECSSPKALARALLFEEADADEGEIGLHLVKRLANYVGPDALPVHLEEIAATVTNMVNRQDSQGRTLAFYVAAFDTALPRSEMLSLKSQTFSADKGDLNTSEVARLNLEGWCYEMELIKEAQVKELCEWILKASPNAFAVRDSNGMTPLQFALANGKRWNKGLDKLVGIKPEWPLHRDRETGLFPFAMAASVHQQDLSTVFELLRYAPHALSEGTMENEE